MRIYLASRYSRREELCGYRSRLESLGHVVTSVWLNGKHQLANDGTPIDDDGNNLVVGRADGIRDYETDKTELSVAMRDRFAKEDFRDVMSCDLCICFTEEPRSDKGRGGRNVEMGIALGAMKRVWVVGPRENIFAWLEDVKQFDSFGEAVTRLPLARTQS